MKAEIHQKASASHATHLACPSKWLVFVYHLRFVDDFLRLHKRDWSNI